MKHHTVRRFDEQLDGIRDTIVVMGRMARRQLTDALEALAKLDAEGCAAVIGADSEIDRHLQHIEGDIIDVLALRQPMGSDLRALVAALRGSRDVERIGDYAKNMARHTVTLCRLDPAPHYLEPLLELGESVRDMLSAVIAAYQRADGELAERVRAMDAAIDAHYTDLFQRLLSDMERGALSPSVGTHLLFVARGLERIGDHITNLAEDVLFIVDGELPTSARDHDDRTAFAIGLN